MLWWEGKGLAAPKGVTAKPLMTVGQGDKGTSRCLGNLTLFQMVGGDIIGVGVVRCLWDHCFLMDSPNKSGCSPMCSCTLGCG